MCVCVAKLSEDLQESKTEEIKTSRSWNFGESIIWKSKTFMLTRNIIWKDRERSRIRMKIVLGEKRFQKNRTNYQVKCISMEDLGCSHNFIHYFILKNNFLLISTWRINLNSQRSLENSLNERLGRQTAIFWLIEEERSTSKNDSRTSQTRLGSKEKEPTMEVTWKIY